MVLGSPASAQEPQPSTWRSFDIGLAPAVGYFLYPQYVDRGYYIHGQPYDLTWSGLQLQLSGDLHWYFPNHPFFGLGMAAAFMIAPNATGVVRHGRASKGHHTLECASSIVQEVRPATIITPAKLHQG